MKALDFKRIFPTANDTSLTGLIRNQPEDFAVDEINSVPLSGDGEHLWLYVRKIGENTDWVARLLARLTGVSRRQVGYAGLKDRHAVTQQWFSIQLPDRAAVEQLSDKLPPTVAVVKQHWHRKKLQKGNLKSNRFRLCVRAINGLDSEQRKIVMDGLLAKIAAQGVPNYFGPQRFGHNMGNVAAVKSWFSGETRAPKAHLRSLYLSSGRSWIFNHVLAERVRLNVWCEAVAGDVFQLQGSHSWFQSKADDALHERLQLGDIHPTGAMWGRGESPASNEVLDMEQRIAQQHAEIRDGLEQKGLKQERRGLRVMVKDLNHQWLDDETLQISFELPSGAFATSVLREILDYRDNSQKANEVE
ncbi:tRNA pseudouridine(13) synthase TruD [Marinicella sp. W31]|uniref:tRNA pseudouridine(13) synthase TruD n=1 Tax=Marinicella sp. W31 TaxID=3023713 RepID=UPI003757E7AE